MKALATALAAVLAAMMVTELALRGAKLQTRLSRVLLAWGAVWAAALVPLDRLGIGPGALTLFWGGALVSWFGVRSHIESSIALRMLTLLRSQPLTEPELVDRYGALEGDAARLRELSRGGLTEQKGGVLSVTAKGRAILRIASKLR